MPSHDLPTETIAVVGALGAQGASVIKTLLESSGQAELKIRALTSSPDSEAAKALEAHARVTVVKCDLKNLKSISDGFADCTYIFGNTAFSGSTLMTEGQQAGERLESQQAMNIVRAASGSTTLKHFIWSTLTDSSFISQGRWKVPHFMSKQAANAYILGGYPGYSGPQYHAEPGWGALRSKCTLMCIGIYGSNLRNHLYRPVKKVSHLERSYHTGFALSLNSLAPTSMLLDYRARQTCRSL
jgi:hypothetical protein